MDIKSMRAKLEEHDAQVAAECKEAITALVGSDAYREVREQLAAIAAKEPRSPIDAVTGSLLTSLDLLEQIGR